MAVVRKTLLPLGKHVSPDGEVDVTPDRVKHWVETFQKQKQNKIKIPMPWGHQRLATPDNKEFIRSRFNAGTLKDLMVGPDGSLDGILEAPGLQEENGQLVSIAKMDDGTPVKTSIADVSVGIFPDWKDGKGNEWNDMIGHVALAPLPVWADQSGFQSLSTAEQKVVYLSTVTRMANTDTEESDLKGKVEKASSATEDDGDDNEGAAKTLDSMFQSAGEEANPEQERVQRIIATFAQLSTPFPPDTTPENFVERLDTVIGVLAARLKLEEQQEAQAEAEKAKMQQTNDQKDQQKPKEEQPPTPQMMLSTLKAVQENPLLKALLDEKLESKITSRKARLAALAERGLPDAEVTRLSAEPIRMSTIIDPQGTKLLDDATDKEIALLERVLPDKKFASIYLSTMTPPDIEPARNPLDAAEIVTEKKYGNVPVTEADDQAIKERVARLNGRA